MLMIYRLTRRFIFLFVIVLLVTGLISGCIPARVTGSGNIVKRDFSLDGFNKVSISYGFTAEVKQSSAYSIEVTADDNLFDYIYVKKDSDTVSIGMKAGSYERSRLQVIVMMPAIRGIELSDGGSTVVSGFSSSDDLSIKLSDGTKLSGSLTAGNVDIVLTDGSRIELEGSAKDIKVVSNDGSKAYLENFSVDNTDLNIGDGGSLTIDVRGTLNADLTAGSRVTYKGNPVLGDINLSAGATVSKLE